MKVLLAVDGSEYSIYAAREVARRPWPEGTEFKVLSAAKFHIPNTPDPWLLVPATYNDLMETELKHMQIYADRAAEVLQQGEGTRGLTVTTAVVKGDPKDVIIEEADEWGADWIVVGSHGYGLLGRFLLGSVSQAIVNHANCSVEVIRQQSQQ